MTSLLVVPMSCPGTYLLLPLQNIVCDDNTWRKPSDSDSSTMKRHDRAIVALNAISPDGAQTQSGDDGEYSRSCYTQGWL